MKLQLALLLLSAMAVAAAGCVRVKPWQREALSDLTMRPDRDPLGTAFDQHVYFSREAATSARAAGSAGCGCN